MKFAASILSLLLLAPSVQARGKKVKVTNGDDSGEGSLRAALESGAKKIEIDEHVGMINIESTLMYTGTKKLEIKGSGTYIKADDDFTLLEVSNGADLKLEDLTFQGIGGFSRTGVRGDGKGIFVFVPRTASGKVKVDFEDVTVEDVAYHGVHISDCDNDVVSVDECGNGNEGGGTGSPASIEVKLEGVAIKNVGRGRFDGDGFRVDERSEGGIEFSVKDGYFMGAGADGVELDEAGPGDVEAYVYDSVFKANGDWCLGANLTQETACDDDGEADVDDGMDMDEADEGSLYLYAENVVMDGNFDEGFDIDEAGDGDLTAYFDHIDALNNNDEGIKCSEEDDGDLEVSVEDSSVVDTMSNDGMQFESEGNGRTDVKISSVIATGSDGPDLVVEQESDMHPGSLRIRDGSVIGLIETSNVEFK